MIYYYLLLLVLVVFCFFTRNENNKTRKKIAITIMVVLLTLLAGLRHYAIGNDTVMYRNAFNQVAIYGSDLLNSSRFEAGYKCLMFFATSLGLSFNAFLFILSLFMNIGVGIFIYRYSKQPMFSFLLFVLFRLFFSEMNIIREFLALTVFLFSIKYIEERKFIKYLLMIVLASFFHSSALFAIVIYYLYDLKLTPFKKFSFAIIAVIAFIFLYDILSYITQLIGVYAGYIDNYYGSNRLASIFMVIISIVIYLFFKAIQKKYLTEDNIISKEETRRLHFYGNILFFLIIFSVIAIKISVFDRLLLYYQIFSIIAIPNAIRLIPSSKKRTFWYIVVFVCFFVYFISVLYLRPEWNMVNPYRFYWE